MKGRLKIKKSKEIVLSVASILFYTIAYAAYSEAEPPNWFMETPNDENNYYGVGHSKESMEDAEAKARETLIMGIAVTIHAEVEQYSESVDDGNSEKMEAEFRTQSRSYAKQELLPGIKIHERRQGASDYYALARLSREKYRQHMNSKHTEVQERVEFGDGRLADGHVIDALKVYSVALKTAETLTFLDGEVSDTVSVLDIKQKIDDVQDDIDIVIISGDGQAVNYDKPLPQPLVVEVSYQNKPLRKCPLRATYTHGTGKLRNNRGETGASVSIYADTEGKGYCWVDAVKSISRKNRVQITVDVEGIATQAVFHYTSTFPMQDKIGAPTVALNGSANEQAFTEGSKVDIQINVPDKCHIHLFSIVADGDFNHLQSVPIERAYTGNGWSVSSTKSGWALQMDQVPLRADYGHGVETLLVVTTEKAWEPNRKTFTTDGLIHQLDESVGMNNWRVGWVSYHIETEKGGDSIRTRSKS